MSSSKAFATPDTSSLFHPSLARVLEGAPFIQQAEVIRESSYMPHQTIDEMLVHMHGTRTLPDATERPRSITSGAVKSWAERHDDPLALDIPDALFQVAFRETFYRVEERFKTVRENLSAFSIPKKLRVVFVESDPSETHRPRMRWGSSRTPDIPIPTSFRYGSVDYDALALERAEEFKPVERFLKSHTVPNALVRPFKLALDLIQESALSRHLLRRFIAAVGNTDSDDESECEGQGNFGSSSGAPLESGWNENPEIFVVQFLIASEPRLVKEAISPGELFFTKEEAIEAGIKLWEDLVESIPLRKGEDLPLAISRELEAVAAIRMQLLMVINTEFWTKVEIQAPGLMTARPLLGKHARETTDEAGRPVTKRQRTFSELERRAVKNTGAVNEMMRKIWG